MQDYDTRCDHSFFRMTLFQLSYLYVNNFQCHLTLIEKDIIRLQSFRVKLIRDDVQHFSYDVTHDDSFYGMTLFMLSYLYLINFYQCHLRLIELKAVKIIL